MERAQKNLNPSSLERALLLNSIKRKVEGTLSDRLVAAASTPRNVQSSSFLGIFLVELRLFPGFDGEKTCFFFNFRSFQIPRFLEFGKGRVRKRNWGREKITWRKQRPSLEATRPSNKGDCKMAGNHSEMERIGRKWTDKTSGSVCQSLAMHCQFLGD